MTKENEKMNRKGKEKRTRIERRSGNQNKRKRRGQE
jgi:hypothetical protein